MVEDTSAPVENAAPVTTATPLLAPADGIPPVVDTDQRFESALSQLAAGRGPFAVDAERASGYKYSARAYLIQIKREGGGLHADAAGGARHAVRLALGRDVDHLALGAHGRAAGGVLSAASVFVSRQKPSWV